jgi:signal transduction histidine kinase/ActR/RegA family two-component response regulator
MMHPSAIVAFQLESAIVRNPLIVTLDTTMLNAIAQMNAANSLENIDCDPRFTTGAATTTSCVLVVENQRLVGILTDRDVVRLIAEPLDLATKWEDLTIDEVMNYPVITLSEDSFTDLSVAIDLLCQHRIRHLPLIDRHDRLIGLLTRESLQQRSHPNELWREHVFKLQKELIDRQIDRELLLESNHQLTMNNEELVRATLLKDEFLANMSHELRTPLNAILGMTEGLQEGIFGAANPAQLQAVQTIERSSNHLLELINDILDLAKIGAGQIELECAPTNIYDLCNSSFAFVKQQAIQKRIRLQIQLPPRIPNISIDERRIRQVLINLLNNAVKFTPIGGNVALNVTIEADNTTSSFIRLAVIDTGIGINSTDLDKLFQPFMQVDIALNRQHNGTGLGLALVKGMVEMHGGTVQVRSEVGVGSQFIVDLPIPQGEYDENIRGLISPALGFSQPDPLQLDAITGESSGKLWTILLAEDNEANISSISSYLKAKGYQTILARNGLEAINIAQSQLPSLILMDIQMPKMDGLEAIRHIRNQPQLNHIPIVALTALAMNGDREKCLEAGANDYLTKPVKLKQLATTIQQFLTVEEGACK